MANCLYVYNGVILPELVWDKTNYPFAAISPLYGTAYVSATPFTIPNTTPLLVSKLKEAENNGEYWAEWEDRGSTSESGLYDTTLWANHDVLRDGQVHCSASEPVPVAYPIVIFDGEATTKEASYSDSASDTITGCAYCLAIGDKVRITLDGVSAEYEVKKVPTSKQPLVGNAGLNGNDVEAEDDGGDWLVAGITGITGPFYRTLYFYTRTAGTHQLKIELLADEPDIPEPDEPTPQDFYIIKNGVGQKQDTYLRVGGQCVKQEEYLS